MKISKLPLIVAATMMALSTAEAIDPIQEDLYVSSRRMKEWNDWRFGLFIHWGPWSQTEIGYIWKIVLEDPPGTREQRFELNRSFEPRSFDPKKWARAAKLAGMKYVVFVTKHHDGFCNYDTALTEYRITGPDSPYAKYANADLTRAVIDAFRAEGLAIGFYYSHIDWHHPDGRYFSQGHWDYDASRIDLNADSWKRFVEYEKGQVRELLTQYGKIDILWFDLYWPFANYNDHLITHPRVAADVRDLLSMMKRLQPDIIFNDRGTDRYGGFRTPEQEVPENGFPGSWEACITINEGRGFWYKGDEAPVKTVRELVRTLVDVASKGGNILLNVAPSPQGDLTPGEYSALAGVGAWMAVNNESIQGTNKAGIHVPWGRTTARDSTLYLHVFDWPSDGALKLPQLETEVVNAYLLSDSKQTPLAVKANDNQISVSVPEFPPDDICSVVVLKLAKPASGVSTHDRVTTISTGVSDSPASVRHGVRD